MKCPKCHTENPDTVKFCGECGTNITHPDEARSSFTKTLETPVDSLTRGTLFADRYETIEELGRGGMGAVYRVEDTKAKEEIAVKLIKPEIAADKKTIERFRKELTTARKISHRNVCRMYDLGEHNGTHFITMEYVPGEDLKSFIRRSKRLSIHGIVSIVKQVCEGLIEAHNLGIVHRDLKHANIMIDKQGNARIMDFGIARSLKSEGLTGEGIAIGTPEYMSPEQVEAEEIDQRSDLYSLGVILYEMATGQLPFQGNPEELNPQIPAEFSGAILRCLEREKNKRFHDANELFSVLDSIEKALPTIEKSDKPRKATTSKEVTVTFSPMRILVPVLMIFILVLIIIFGLKFLPGGGRAPTSSNIVSVGILPFDDLSPEQDHAYLCNGLAVTLITALSKIERLYVPAPDSVMRFQTREKDYQDIGEKLNVGAVLEGSIQISEDRLRIHARLINVTDKALIWSEQFDSTMDDIFRIQDDIASAIVNRLRVELQEEEKDNLAMQETDSVEAYQFYLRGRDFRYREDVRDYFRAKEAFEQSISYDPNFAPAYAGLAEAYMMLGYHGYIPKGEGESSAKEYAQKALDLAPNSSEAHSAMGVIIEIYDWDWKEAERRFLHAIELNPKNFGAHWEYGLLLLRMDRMEESEQRLLMALDFDPLSDSILSTMVRIYNIRGRPDKAQIYIDKLKELGISADQLEYNVATVSKRVERYGRLPYLLGLLGVFHVKEGNEDEARQLIVELEDLAATTNLAGTAIAISWIANNLGDRAKALEWLDIAFERREPAFIEMKHAPWFAGLENEPRYIEILKAVGLD